MVMITRNCRDDEEIQGTDHRGMSSSRVDNVRNMWSISSSSEIILESS